MSSKQHLVDTVVVKGGAVDAYVHGLPRQLDSFQVVVRTDTLLVKDVTPPGGLWGWSWDAWSGTGEWFSPLAVFLLTLLFAWIGKQWQVRRQQRAQVAHFRAWRQRVLENMRAQAEAIRRFSTALDITQANELPRQPLERFDLFLEQWLDNSPTEMTRVFVVNKQGSVEANTSALQDTLTFSRSVEVNAELAFGVFRTLGDELEKFKVAWSQQVKSVSDLLVSIMEERYPAMENVDPMALRILIGQNSFYDGPLAERYAAMSRVIDAIDLTYQEYRQPAYSAVTAELLLLRRSIFQIKSTEDRAKQLLVGYLKEIETSVSELDKASEVLDQAEDKWFIGLL